MHESLQHIWFQASYILGWSSNGKQITLYMELFLTERHPKWEKKKRDEFGCYKTAELSFDGATNVQGLPRDNQKVEWDSKLPEYISHCEIEEFKVGSQNVRIQGDGLKLSFEFDRIELRFDVEGEWP